MMGKYAYDEECNKYTGQKRDNETGLDYFGARYFSAPLGRFMRPDPLLNSGRPDNPQTWNRYAYVLNNPLRYIDPTGLWEWEESDCAEGDKKCENEYKKNQKAFKDSLDFLKMARDYFNKDSMEYNRIDAALKAFGKEGDGGIGVGFRSLNGADGQTVDSGNGKFSVFFDSAKIKDAQRFATVTGHEGTHVDDRIQINQGASALSHFSLEYRGYETSAFVFQGLATPRQSASPGTSLSGVTARGMSIRGIEIWNTSWGAADAPVLRDQRISNIVIGLGPEYGETTPHNPWR